MNDLRHLPSDLLEQASLPTAALSLDGLVLLANSSFCALLGRSHDEVQQRELGELGLTLDPVPPPVWPELGDALVTVRRQGDHTGSARLSWRLVRDARGRPSYLHTVLFDEEPRLEAERALAASEARWNALLARAATAGWTGVEALEDPQDDSARGRTRSCGPAQPATSEHGLDLLLAMRHAGSSLETIASALNRLGFQTPSGRRWHRTSVARALTDATHPLPGAGDPAR